MSVVAAALTSATEEQKQSMDEMQMSGGGYVPIKALLIRTDM